MRFLVLLPIRVRLAIWFALVLLASVVGVGAFLLAALENDLHREIDEALALRAARVEREIAPAGEELFDPREVHEDILTLTPLEEFSSPGIYVQVHDHLGAVIAAPPQLRGGELPATADMLADALAGRTVYETLPVGSERVRVLLRPLRSASRVIGVVVVGESLHPMEFTQRTMRQTLVAAALAVALACFIGGWWLTGSALRPVAAVSRLARRIRATGRFDQRIEEPEADDELRELSVTFNEMLAGLEQTLTRQREFLADASHELRGPLAVVRGNLSLLTQNLPPEERRAALRDMAEEVERMTRLIADLLFLAEADAEEMVEHQPARLDEVVAEVWRRARRIDEGAHVVELAANERVTVSGDRERLIQLLWNLVDNALRYTPRDGRVTLALYNRGAVAELTVADTGVGIPDEHLPHVFERFYRADRARVRQGSTGLGLAIAKQIAEAHGGHVSVHSTASVGSVFRIVLPAQPAIL